MVRTLQSLTDAGKEIAGLPPGTIILLQDDYNITWRYFFAHGKSFLLGYGETHITLKRPDGGTHFAGEVTRLIPHPDGPIILDADGNLTQGGKPFSHRSGIPAFRSIPSITRTAIGLVVNSLNGSPCVNVTESIP